MEEDMTTVLVLGASGMLGSMVVDVLSREPDVAVTAAQRGPAGTALRNVRYADEPFDALHLEGSASLFRGQTWVINCIGVTKPLIREDNPEEIEYAVAVNSLFPH